MDDTEIAHLLRLLETHKKVLNQLEEQAVGYAGAVPTHISLQIDSNKEAIEQVKAKLSLVLIPRRTADATGPDAASVVTRFRIEEVRDMLLDSLTTLQRQMREQDETTQQRIKRVEERTTQAVSDVARENARQTKRLDTLRTGQEYMEARQARVEEKIDNFILAVEKDKTEGKSGRRRNFILLVLVLVLLVFFMMLIIAIIRNAGLI
jgi:ABC-type Na+ efflux pump permease subunit